MIQSDNETSDLEKSDAAQQAATVEINPDFIQILNQRFAKYRLDKYQDFPKAGERKQEFVADVNGVLQQIAGRRPIRHDDFHPLTPAIFAEMLAGNVGPTPELVQAMWGAFKIYDEWSRETFVSHGALAANDENKRRQAVYLASPEGREAARAKVIAEQSALEETAASQATQQRVESQRDAWRANNPEGMKGLPSFQEMLEASHANGEDFKAFLFKRVLPTWNNMSQVGFCGLLRTLNTGNDDVLKPTVTDTVLSSWHSGKTKPLRDSVDVIRHAFGIKPAEGELMARHEKMLWKAIDGHVFTWKDKKGIEALDAAIEETRKSGNTGPLVSELIDASGIRFERLKESLNIEQISQWKKGAKIQNIDMALQFLQLVNPQATEEIAEKKDAKISRTVSKQNKEILSLITEREFDIEKILAAAKAQGHPGGALFTMLTGRNGLLTISTPEIVVQFNAAGLECNEHKIKKMRAGAELQRGGKITEPYANAILKMVEGSMQHLVDIGVCKPFTKEQKEDCVDTLTGVPHPKKMLQSAIAGSLPIGKVVSNACERLGTA